MTERTNAIKRRIRRLKTLPVLPTLLTAGNLASGITAVLCAAHAGSEPGDKWLFYGAIAVFFAMICDMLDGKVARLTNTAGAFGAELDSLSDVVSFGVAPAILVHRLVLGRAGIFDHGERVLWFITVFYPVMAAIRLARYNVEHTDDEATAYFRGLPSPGAAALLCAWVIFVRERHDVLVQYGFGTLVGTFALYDWLMMGLSMVAALLMVSTFRFPHLGNSLLGRLGFRKLIVMLLMVSFLFFDFVDALVIVTTAYLFLGLGCEALLMFRKWQQGRNPLDDPEEDEAEDAGISSEKDADTGPAHGR